MGVGGGGGACILPVRMSDSMMLLDPYDNENEVLGL